MTIAELEATLGGFLDFWPWPKTWSGELQQLGASSRPVSFVATASGRVTCRTCAGRGRLENKRACHDCKGQGGWGFDPYVGKLFGGEPEPLSPAHRVRERERAGDKLVDAVADTRARREQHPACRAVTRALAELPAGVRGLLVWTYVLNGQHATTQARDALALLAALVEYVRAPGWVTANLKLRRDVLALAKGKGAARNVQVQRDQSIRDERQEGATLAELAQRYGLDKSRVSRIASAA